MHHNPNYRVLNLGCGMKQHPDAVNVDIDEEKNPDVVFDLNRPAWPWNKSGFDVVIVHHILEHVSDAVNFVENCWKALKPEGRLNVRVPHYQHLSAFTDPTHKRYFTEDTFQMFTHSRKSNSLTDLTWEICYQDIEWEKDYRFPYWHLQKYLGIDVVKCPMTIVCQLTPNKGDSTETA